MIKRHNRIRDMVADFLNDVAHGVHTEPGLQPLTGEQLPEGSNCSDEARVDVAARGFWQDCEMAYFDVKVFNPFARSHLRERSIFMGIHTGPGNLQRDHRLFWSFS